MQKVRTPSRPSLPCSQSLPRPSCPHPASQATTHLLQSLQTRWHVLEFCVNGPTQYTLFPSLSRMFLQSCWLSSFLFMAGQHFVECTVICLSVLLALALWIKQLWLSCVQVFVYTYVCLSDDLRSVTAGLYRKYMLNFYKERQIFQSDCSIVRSRQQGVRVPHPGQHLLFWLFNLILGSVQWYCPVFPIPSPNFFVFDFWGVNYIQ